MSVPGEYVVDATEGITHPDDLPKPGVSNLLRNCYNAPQFPP